MEQNENLPQNEEMTVTEHKKDNLCWSKDTPGALDIYSYPQLLSIKEYMKIAVIYPFFILIGLALLGIFYSETSKSIVLYNVLLSIMLLLPFIGLMQKAWRALIYRKRNAPFLVKSAFWVSMLFWAIIFVSYLMQKRIDGGVVLSLLLSVIYGFVGLKECGADEFEEVFPKDFRKVRIVDFVLIYDFFIALFILWWPFEYIRTYLGWY